MDSDLLLVSASPPIALNNTERDYQLMTENEN